MSSAAAALEKQRLSGTRWMQAPRAGKTSAARRGHGPRGSPDWPAETAFQLSHPPQRWTYTTDHNPRATGQLGPDAPETQWLPPPPTPPFAPRRPRLGPHPVKAQQTLTRSNSSPPRWPHGPPGGRRPGWGMPRTQRLQMTWPPATPEPAGRPGSRAGHEAKVPPDILGHIAFEAPAPSQGPALQRRPRPLAFGQLQPAAPDAAHHDGRGSARQEGCQHCCCPLPGPSAGPPGKPADTLPPSECQEGGRSCLVGGWCACSFLRSSRPQVSGPVRPWREPLPQQMLWAPCSWCAGRWAPPRPCRPEHAGSPGRLLSGVFAGGGPVQTRSLLGCGPHGCSGEGWLPWALSYPLSRTLPAGLLTVLSELVGGVGLLFLTAQPAPASDHYTERLPAARGLLGAECAKAGWG